MEKSKITHIIIAICTYKRENELERCLLSLCDINHPENIKTDILVIDNDSNKSAEKIAEKFQTRLNIYYTVENKQGLSNARNKALNEALNLGASHLAFIDDDEIADKNWLICHIDFYNKFKEIYISSGPTYKKFEQNYPDYIVNNTVFKVNSSKNLGAVKKTCASGNVFFPLNIIKENNIYFDERFNLSGSEDTDFFGRLYKAGYKIGWNYNAINYEIVSPQRANVKWILKRAFHNGYSVSMTKFLGKKFNLKRIIYIIEKIFTLVVNSLTVLISLPFGLTKILNSLVRFNKNSGKLCGAICSKSKTYYGK